MCGVQRGRCLLYSCAGKDDYAYARRPLDPLSRVAPAMIVWMLPLRSSRGLLPCCWCSPNRGDPVRLERFIARIVVHC